jgi:folate-binding protein YgfZ
MPQASFVILEERGVLAVSGPDRTSFLQGLVSNDVGKLASDRALYAALLTAQGKYLHDFMLIEYGDAICLDGEAARLADLKWRLSMYRLRAKVTIEERPDLAVAVVFGADALDVLGLPADAGAARRFGDGVVLVDPRFTALGARCLLPRAGMREALAAAGLSEADFAEYDRLRLSFGVPDGSRDLVVEKSILLEAGFDELHGVDWQKGCYIGQELTARTKYRGLIKKRLFPVRIEGSIPAVGAILTLDGREAGEMRSGRDEFGLALVRLEAVAAGRPLLAESAGASVTPLPVDWMRIDAKDSPSPTMREREEGPVA